MKLTVRTADEPDSEASGNIDGEHIVLDLDPTYTKFYAGGVPASANVRGNTGENYKKEAYDREVGGRHDGEHIIVVCTAIHKVLPGYWYDYC